MADFDFDLIVIGGGSGGVRAARMAASYGARVALIEAGRMGGTCVNVGCVPKKLLAYGGHYASDLEDMTAYGWRVEGPARFDWPTLKVAKDQEIARLNGIYDQLLERAGVEVIAGRGAVVGTHRVSVSVSGEPVGREPVGRELTSRYLLIATGGRPWRPEPGVLPGIEHTWTSDDIFALDALPDRIVVVGGGYIGCEMASILHSFGVRVHLIHRGETLLRGFDADLGHELGNELRKRGVHLHLLCTPQRIQRVDGHLRIEIEAGDTIEADAVLMATGRVPNTAGLGLQAAGVELSERGAVLVDDRFRSTCPSIFAVGDVIDRMQLTPVALAEGMRVARNLFLGEDEALDYRFVPTAVFTHPGVGTVGWTEADAARHFDKLRLYKSSFRPMRHTLTGRNARTSMKIIVDDATDQVVGLHVVGEDAAEIVQGFAVALRCGVTKAQLDTTIGIHPSAAEELVTMRTEWTPAS
ncbi:MAG TPA: glutathione-disulfide reductase [Deltaproteobacteria bacterium]|nr:glutathione-disulfide reductase [Deltaproteobacteria bacterium]